MVLPPHFQASLWDVAVQRLHACTPGGGCGCANGIVVAGTNVNEPWAHMRRWDALSYSMCGCRTIWLQGTYFVRMRLRKWHRRRGNKRQRTMRAHAPLGCIKLLDV